ncbi:Uncharacterised protein [Legionella bozemanae]|uniref:Uncharacterized protein n=1 Tax=Legionella bozemanae TaxID=447 RepID=A0A0W0S274_LEGBO|nr:hypothetical protein Lboz_0391 [Legionella bozemanae]STO32757.1 Uncharacterised protein [Legionella bozemanae]
MYGCSYVPRLVRGIQESCSVSEFLDPADKPQEVGKLSLYSFIEGYKIPRKLFC